MRQQSVVTFAVLATLLYAGVVFADQFSSTNYIVSDPVVFPGGFSSSASFEVQSIISQTAIGTSTAASFGNNAGALFYPFVSTPAVSATAGNAQVALSWTAASGLLGWNVGGYTVGQATVSGGPYTYGAVGNVTSATQAGLSNGTPYYFVIRVQDAFGNFIATSTEVSATPSAPAAPPPSSGGGGGGGGGGAPVLPPSGNATVILDGRAYPGSVVTVLRDSVIVSQAPAEETAAFSVNVGNLNAGTYLFSLYTTDATGNRSSTVSLPITVGAGVTTHVTGIFLAPTVDVDKSQVKRGDPIRVFGQSAPSSTVMISVNSDNELLFQTSSDGSGVYSYSFLTTPLEIGQHTTHTSASKSGEVSRVSASVGFTVGTTNVDKTKTAQSAPIKGDVNGDSRVNITDFSIEAFWYKKGNPPAKYDFNGDGKVDIIDFSIMASHWTG